MGTVPNVRS